MKNELLTVFLAPRSSDTFLGIILIHLPKTDRKTKRRLMNELILSNREIAHLKPMADAHCIHNSYRFYT